MDLTETSGPDSRERARREIFDEEKQRSVVTQPALSSAFVLQALDSPTVEHEAAKLWASVLGKLQLTIGAVHFDAYLRGTRGLVYDQGTSVLRVAASNPFHVPWLEGKLSSPVHTAVMEVVGEPVRVEFVSDGRSAPQPVPAGGWRTSNDRPARSRPAHQRASG